MKTVIHMAAECMLFEALGPDEFEAALAKFAELVRADEREACAQVCEDHFSSDGDWCSKTIRARSNT